VSLVLRGEVWIFVVQIRLGSTQLVLMRTTNWNLVRVMTYVLRKWTDWEIIVVMVNGWEIGTYWNVSMHILRMHWKISVVRSIVVVLNRGGMLNIVGLVLLNIRGRCIGIEVVCRMRIKDFGTAEYVSVNGRWMKKYVRAVK